MFQDDPTFAIINFAIAAYLFYLWLTDFKFYSRQGETKKGLLEGAKPVSLRFCAIAICLSLLLLGVHTFSEISFGVQAQQTSVAPWALISWIGAAFVEELIFRGYLVIQNKGRALLLGSILLASVVFALGHPFMWDYTVGEGASVFDGVWSFKFSAQSILATLAVFECSLLFYLLRFIPANKNRSLIPCVCAHCAYNIGVFTVKASQGFVAW